MTRRFSMSAVGPALLTGTRSGFVGVPILGPYFAQRYWPKANRDAYLRLLGLRRNYLTGLYDGDLYKPDEPVWQDEVFLDGTGSRSGNEAALTNIANNAADSRRNVVVWVQPDAVGGWAGQIPDRGENAAFFSVQSRAIRDGGFPRAKGKRIQQSDANLAKFYTVTSNQPALRFSKGTRRVWLRGLHFAANPTWNLGTPFAPLGDHYLGLLGYLNEINTSEWPREIVLEQLRLISDDAFEKPVNRLLVLDGERIILRDSWMKTPGWNINDGQCFWTEKGGGRIQVENNYLACAAWGENLFIGGGGSNLPSGRVHNGVLVQRNHFDFPQEWWGVLGHKNLIESKGANNVAAQANLFANYLGNGSALNQYFAVAWKGSQAKSDGFILRVNDFRECHGFFSPSADEWGVENIDAHQNLVRKPTTGYRSDVKNCSTQWGSFSSSPTKVRNSRMAYNYIQGPHITEGGIGVAFPDAAPAGGEEGVEFTDNIFDKNATDSANWYVFKAGMGTNNQGAWDAAMLGGSNNAWERNLVSYVTANLVNSDVGVANSAALQLGADLSLLPTSPGYTLAEDGGPVGADPVLVASATAGVETGL